MAAGKADARYDPRVDTLIQKSASFAQPILKYLRTAVHTAAPEVTETIKWSRAFFLLDDQILANMAAFRQHCAFGFWSAEMNKVLAADGVDGRGSSGSLGKIVAVDDLPAEADLLRYLQHAVRLIRKAEASPVKAGERTRKPPLPMPEPFRAALAANPSAQQQFNLLPPSCRREYLEWITGAKREDTRERRTSQAVAMIASGRRFNDQYRNADRRN